jgi:hypothetical protein
MNGASLQVRFADGVWHRGRLVVRVSGTGPPRWKVQFDDGETRDDMGSGTGRPCGSKKARTVRRWRRVSRRFETQRHDAVGGWWI